MGKDGGGKTYYDKATLTSALEAATERQAASKIHMRNKRYGEMAGPGRGHKKPVLHEHQLDLFSVVGGAGRSDGNDDEPATTGHGQR